MLDVNEILAIAIHKIGSQESVESLMPTLLSQKQLQEKTDDRYLSDMSRRVFQAGFRWQVINNRWPAFEERFFHFNPKRCAFINPEEIDERMRDERLIRHRTNMNSIAPNAYMVDRISQKYGGFGHWLAAWPSEDIVDLWLYLKKHGSRLGGRSGSMFLRMAGKDTFILTDDVVQALLNFKIIDSVPSSKKSLYEVQTRFNHWRTESDRPLCEISKLLSLTV